MPGLRGTPEKHAMSAMPVMIKIPGIPGMPGMIATSGMRD